MLAQAEAVGQLVGARSVAAADSALAGLQGGIGQTIATLRLDALTLLADIEVRPLLQALFQLVSINSRKGW